MGALLAEAHGRERRVSALPGCRPRNIPPSRSPIFSAPCNTSRRTDSVASAAEASFLTLSHAPGKGFWLSLYRKLPGFAPLSELAYAFIAAHRSAFYRISLLLWGKDYEPPRYDLAAFLFLRLFGLIYFSAFVSFGVQAQGLIGSHGILPLRDLIDALERTRRRWSAFS